MPFSISALCFYRRVERHSQFNADCGQHPHHHLVAGLDWLGTDDVVNVVQCADVIERQCG